MSNPNILIYDTDLSQMEFFKTSFEGLYNIWEAKTLTDALSNYSQNYMQIRIVLVSLDIDNQTHEVIEKMKIISDLPEIIVYSKSDRVKKAVTAMKVGATNYFSMPTTKSTIVNVIESTLNEVNIFNKLSNQQKHTVLTDFNINSDSLINEVMTSDLQVDTQNETHSSPRDYLLSKIKNKLSHTYNQFNKQKVLIIEDEELYRSTLTNFLANDYDCMDAENGQVALEIIEQKSFDVILLDVFLPDYSGLDLLPLIKEKLPNSQVIIITAFEFVDIAVKSLQQGAVDYINKPFLKKQIIDAVNVAIKMKLSKIILPELIDNIIENDLPYEIKLELIEYLFYHRVNVNDCVYMSDIYRFFPQLRESQVPEELYLPQNIFKTSLKNFISDMETKITKNTN